MEKSQQRKRRKTIPNQDLQKKLEKWYFVTKIVLTNLFEAEGREFAKILRSLELFIQTVKGQNNFW